MFFAGLFWIGVSIAIWIINVANLISSSDPNITVAVAVFMVLGCTLIYGGFLLGRAFEQKIQDLDKRTVLQISPSTGPETEDC